MADVLKKVPVREQAPKVRATNFEEVCLGKALGASSVFPFKICTARINKRNSSNTRRFRAARSSCILPGKWTVEMA